MADRTFEDALLREAFTLSQEPLAALDSGRKVRLFSRGAARLLGRDACGQPAEGLFAEPAACGQLLQAAESGVVSGYEAWLKHQNGARLRRRVAVRTLEGKAGPAGWLLSFEASAPRRGSAEKTEGATGLLQLERFASVGRMAASFAHDVRGPLHVISSAAEAALANLPTGDALRAPLDMIGRNAAHAALSAQSLVDFSKTGSCRLKSEALDPVVAAALSLAEKDCLDAGIRVQKALGDPPPLPLDARLLQGVFYNLITNARQAMSRGGTLSVTTGRDRQGVYAVVADTGAGMSAEVLARASKPFFTTKSAGTGLGLYACRLILAEHQAELFLESVKGRGTSARIRFQESTQ